MLSSRTRLPPIFDQNPDQWTSDFPSYTRKPSPNLKDGDGDGQSRQTGAEF